MMALAQKLRHLEFCELHRIAIEGRDGDELQVGIPDQLLLGGGVRHFDAVVLVESEGGLTLGREDADHAERYVLDANGLTDWILGAEEHLDHRLPDQRHVGRAPYVLLAEERTLRHRPVADNRKRYVDAVHLGEPVLVTVEHLYTGFRARRDQLHRRTFAP